jgi:hypothetical protein
VLISILEPDNMYIFKNTGTMVIGVSKGLQSEDQKIQSIEEIKEVPMVKTNSNESDESPEHPHQF